ncbi:Putative cysteine peptidase (modular protein) [Syntrophobacter sp. SbD1]|nr:Putative cysteine peptidase (modular protein) [Syntrophobacter sp. SbD1]
MFTKRTKQSPKTLFLAIALTLLFSSFAAASPEELGTVQTGIWNSHAPWVADETPVSRLPRELRPHHLGLIKHGHKLSQNQLQSVSSPAKVAGTVTTVTPPATLDYRNYNNGLDCVTPITDQGNCGSCWAFATTAALESQVLMKSSISTDESEQILVSCGGAGDCNGGYIDLASDFIQTTGLPPESCFPYTGTNNSCSNAVCPSWQSDTYNITAWQWVTMESPTVDAIKSALTTYGPLVTTMNVYADFYYYTGGVYSYTSGTLEGGHAILIIGYDDNNQYFIVKNSWGTGWGEAGFFRIAYSQLTNAVQFGADTIAYTGASQPGGALSVTIGPAGAATAGAEWKVDNGGWQVSGATVSGLIAGSHTVSFNTISGWTTPSSQTVTISNGQTASASGTYVQQGGSLTVSILPQGAITAGAKWQVDGGAWQNSGATVSALAAGQLVVNFGTIPSWTTPASQTVSISNGLTTTATGTYVQQTGSLAVSIAPAGAITAGAKWQVDGGAWQNSGATVSGLVVGQHAVNFGTISGWTTPAGQTVSVSNGLTTTATGTYVQQTGSLAVNIAPSGAITAGAKWQVDGGAWQNSGATVSGLVVGQHAVIFSTVPGWNTPSGQTVSVSNGLTTTATGTYVLQTGSMSVSIAPAGAITAGAKWQVDGGAWQNSGATVSGLAVGQHAVNFSAISGWNTPSGQTAGISNGLTTTASGTYVQQPGGQQTGSLSVSISPPAAVSAGAKWRVDGGAWQNSGATVSGLAVGQHAVNFSTVTNWTAPAGQTVTIDNGLTTTATGTYWFNII